MRTFLLIVSLVLLLGVARLCVFTVDRAEYVYLTQFGRHVATFDGANGEQAGLHFKWPWPIQSVQSIDRRLQYMDLPGAELLTLDKERGTIDQTLTIDAYVCWRIPDSEAVDRFVRTVGTIDGAKALLDKDINNELGAAISRKALKDLIDTNRTHVEQQRNELPSTILDTKSPARDGKTMRESTLERYGIEIVDIRLRRTNHPAAVRSAIYDRIISERDRKAAEYQSEGERIAAGIRSQTDLKVSEMKAGAERKALETRGDGDATADRILNEAAMRRPEFYAFLKELEDLQRLLSTGKTLLLLSTKRFRALDEPPLPEKKEEPSPE